jgi:hypothetical protein
MRADFFIRLRRPSTVVVFLLLSAVPYLWIPDPSTGRTLFQISGHRAIYNSAAIGMATAVLGTLFIGLVGFYVVSNALKRDVVSRCGYVIGSTTMRGSEYIAGKFAGNVAFLTIFTLGYMTTAMVMVLVRGEAPLQPLLFAKQYALLLPPAIVFVSAAAIFFECTPLLRTKFGDVLYFFVWLSLMGFAATMIEQGVAVRWARYFDVSGLGFLLEHMKSRYHTESMSIGASAFDRAKAPVVFTGLDVDYTWLLPRIVTMLWPLALLAAARLFFHRFDPARVRAVASASSRTWAGRFNAMAKPLARLLTSLLPRGGSSSLLGAARADAIATIDAFPLVVVGVIAFAIAALASDAHALFTGVLPVAFAACAISIADISCREKRAGTTALVYAAPSLRTHFVWWKFASALLVASAFLAVPLARAITLRPPAAPALLSAVIFTCAAATTLGTVSANAKTFIVSFLTFWYIATQDKGATPSLDFANFFGHTTPTVTAAYLATSAAALTTAHLLHTRTLAAKW